MNPIVIHPGLPREKFDANDIYDRKTKIDVFEPENSREVIETLETLGSPVAFVCANKTWSDDYLDHLREDDWISTIGAGYDNYPINEFIARNLTFTNTPGIHDEPIGEHAFGLLFGLSRGLFEYYEQQREHVWERNLENTDYGGDTCCIVGLGRIGEPLARRARAFDMHVRGVKRTVEGYEGAAHEVYRPANLGDALEGARVVFVSVPLSPETEGFLGYDSLSQCADDAVVVNVARGPVIDTEALIELLDQNRLGSAALDVFNTEPLPPESPLWDRDDVILTPHAAATTDKATDRILGVFLAQYERWLTDEDLEHRITH